MRMCNRDEAMLVPSLYFKENVFTICFNAASFHASANEPTFHSARMRNLFSSPCPIHFHLNDFITNSVQCITDLHRVSDKFWAEASLIDNGGAIFTKVLVLFSQLSLHSVPKFKLIGSYVTLYYDLLSVYVECLCHNLKWRKTSSNVSW